MTTTEITTTESQYQTDGERMLTEAQAFVVTDADSYAEACRRFKTCKEFEKRVTAFFYDGPNGETKQGMIPKAKAAWDAACASFKKLAAPAQDSASLYEQKGGAWKKAEDARLERERLEREAAARKQAEDDAIAQAHAAEKAGDHQMAEEIITGEVFVPPVAPIKAAPKVAGVAQQKYYGATVTSLEALILAAADSIKNKDGKVPVKALCADMVYLNGQARLNKKEGQLYPGVVVVSREGMASR